MRCAVSPAHIPSVKGCDVANGLFDVQKEDVLTRSHIAQSIGIVSAPLWDSKTSTFAGLLTTSDYINVIQYYFQNPAALGEIDQFRLDSLRGTPLVLPAI